MHKKKIRENVDLLNSEKEKYRACFCAHFTRQTHIYML